MRATSRMSRCTHWMHVGWRHPSLAGAPGEICLRAKHTRFRVGSQIPGLPRDHGFCWRRSRRVPCLIRNGLVAEADRVVAGAGVAVAGAEAVDRVEAEQAAAVGAEPAVERVEAAQAAVALAERAVAAAVGPAAEQEEALVVEPEEAEEAPAAGDLSPASTHLPIASREQSCRSFQLRLRRISRFLLR